MNFPVWIKPALTGAGLGAVATAIVGFTWGGWVTGGSALEMASKQSEAAVVATLTPYCVQQSTNATAAAVLAELEAASGFNRRAVIENAGWATPLGTDAPNRALAQACQLALAAAR